MNIQSNPQVLRVLSTVFGTLALISQSSCTDSEEDLELRDLTIESSEDYPPQQLVNYIGIGVMNFPYLNQNDIPNIGWAACSSASAAMVLAYDGKIGSDQATMIGTAADVFAATANLQVGLLGAAVYSNYLEMEWGYSSVEWKAPNQAQLFGLLVDQLNKGRPVILGTKPGGINDAGHYVVVLGVDNKNDYEVANIIIADPNGRWLGFNNWDEGANGLGVSQSFVDFTIAPAAGIFILTP